MGHAVNHSKVITLKEHYEIYRDYLKHEDDLIHYRLTWGLTFHGFLFASLGLSLQKMIDPAMDRTTGVFSFLQAFAVLVIPSSGIVTAWFCRRGVMAAHASIKSLEVQWDDVYREARTLGSVPTLPKLAGGGSPEAGRYGHLSSSGTIWTMLIAWSVVFVLGMGFSLWDAGIHWSASRNAAPSASVSPVQSSAPTATVSVPPIAPAREALPSMTNIGNDVVVNCAPPHPVYVSPPQKAKECQPPAECTCNKRASTPGPSTSASP